MESILTICNAKTESALKPPTTFYKCHERTHVGLTPVTSDGTIRSMVCDRRGHLQQKKNTKGLGTIMSMMRDRKDLLRQGHLKDHEGFDLWWERPSDKEITKALQSL